MAKTFATDLTAISSMYVVYSTDMLLVTFLGSLQGINQTVDVCACVTAEQVAESACKITDAIPMLARERRVAGSVWSRALHCKAH